LHQLTVYDLQACVIFGSVTIFGILSWYFTPEEKWLSRQQVMQALHAADQPEVTRD
jgi:translation initiation factor 5B